MTFVPAGFLKLWDAIDEAGVSLADVRQVKWRSDLRQMDSRIQRGGKSYRTSQAEFQLHQATIDEINKREVDSGVRLGGAEAQDVWRGFRDNMDLEELIALRDEVEHGCRSLLHLGDVPAWVLQDGNHYDMPCKFWGTSQGERLITGCTDKASKVQIKGRYGVFPVSGLIVLKKTALARAIASMPKPEQINEVEADSITVFKNACREMLQECRAPSGPKSLILRSLLGLVGSDIVLNEKGMIAGPRSKHVVNLIAKDSGLDDKLQPDNTTYKNIIRELRSIIPKRQDT